MKKYLPKTKTNPSGFTLIELLVVIAIIAILSVVGVTLFTTSQNKARDARRVQDITAMSRAMEVNYTAGTGYQTVINATWFADSVIPSNPNPGGTPYYTNTPATNSYTFCALLENNSTGNATTSSGGGIGTSTGSYFCKKNSQ